MSSIFDALGANIEFWVERLGEEFCSLSLVFFNFGVDGADNSTMCKSENSI